MLFYLYLRRLQFQEHHDISVTGYGDILPERFEESPSLMATFSLLDITGDGDIGPVRFEEHIFIPIPAPSPISTQSPSAGALCELCPLATVICPCVQWLARSSLAPRGVHFRHALPCLPVHIYWSTKPLTSTCHGDIVPAAFCLDLPSRIPGRTPGMVHSNLSLDLGSTAEELHADQAVKLTAEELLTAHSRG